MPYFSQIERSRSDLNSEYLENVYKSLQKVQIAQKFEEIVCLGLGQFSNCVISRYQLSFILNLSEKFQVSAVKFSDPVFTATEKDILKKLGFQVLDSNLEGKYLCEKPTIYFFPHCPKQLSNNLIWRNFCPQNLKNVVLIGNSFRNIIDTTPERLLRPQAHFILEISPYVTEEYLENNFKFTDIFNDTAIHHFPEEILASLPKEFWENNSEPIYSEEDREFVKNDTSAGT